MASCAYATAVISVASVAGQTARGGTWHLGCPAPSSDSAPALPDSLLWCVSNSAAFLAPTTSIYRPPSPHHPPPVLLPSRAYPVDGPSCVSLVLPHPAGYPGPSPSFREPPRYPPVGQATDLAPAGGRGLWDREAPTTGRESPATGTERPPLTAGRPTMGSLRG